MKHAAAIASSRDEARQAASAGASPSPVGYHGEAASLSTTYAGPGLRTSLMTNVYTQISQQPNVSLLNAINAISSLSREKLRRAQESDGGPGGDAVKSRPDVQMKSSFGVAFNEPKEPPR